MKFLSIVLSLVTAILWTTAFAQQNEDRATRHWRRIGLTAEFLKQPVFLNAQWLSKPPQKIGWRAEIAYASPVNKRYCYKSEKQFQACMAALAKFAQFSKEGSDLFLMPSSLIAQPEFGVTSTQKDFGGLAVVVAKVDAGKLSADQIKKMEADSKKAIEDLRVKTSSTPLSLVEILDYLDASVVNPEIRFRAVPAAYTAFLSVLDGHSRIDNQTNIDEELNAGAPDGFVGVGIQIDSKNGQTTVINPIEDGPGEAAGILPKDEIVSVDGVSIIGMKSDEVVSKIRGVAGTTVTLGILRNGQPLEIPIVRKAIVQENVRAKTLVVQNESYGWLRLSHFMDKKACGKIRTELQAYEADAAIAGVILDLRNNPGGLLDQAQCIGGLFVGANKPFTAVGLPDSPKPPQELRTTANQVYKKPLGVLINYGSASASEMLSGALQDHGRAWVGGGTSFGKGSVQSPENVALNDGKGGFIETELRVYVTVNLFFQPSGRTNQLVGIVPNFKIPMDFNGPMDDIFPREKDLVPNAVVPKNQAPWQETRQSSVEQINDCVVKEGVAPTRIDEKIGIRPSDHQLFVMQDVLHCQNKLGIK